MKETYKVKRPDKITWGDPWYMKEFSGEKLQSLIVDFEPPKYCDARVVLEEQHEITRLKEEQSKARCRRRLAQNYEQRVKDMDAFLQNTSQGLPEFDDDLVRRLIGNIKVVSTESITIQFKSGIVMEQQLNEEW